MNINKRVPGAAEAEDGSAVLLFDGYCNLCAGAVRFVLPRDCRGRLRFASLQSDVGRTLLRRVGRTAFEASGGANGDPESLVLIEKGRAYERSTAALRVAARLCRGWPLLGVFLLVPRPLRDFVYRWVARNRYRWFGRRDACYVPDADVSDRFLDA